MLGRPLPYAVMHISEFMAQLKREGKNGACNLLEELITYHDPCQISRRGGATEDARYLLQDFAHDFREMTPSGNFNWCCGGGGGVQAIARVPWRSSGTRCSRSRWTKSSRPAARR